MGATKGVSISNFHIAYRGSERPPPGPPPIMTPMTPNQSFQRTVKKLRFSPSAEFKR